MTATLNTILQHGAKNNPSVLICSYLNDTQLSRVSKAFRKANLCATVEVCRRINLSHPVKMEARAAEAAQILQGRPVEEFEAELFQEVSRGVEGYFSQLTGERLPYATILRDHWDALILQRTQLLEEPPSKRREDRLNLLVTGLSPVKERLGEMPSPDQDGVVELLGEIVAPMVTLLKLERVERRLIAALQGRDLHLPENSPSILAALHTSQKQEAHLHAEARALFLDHSRSHKYSFDPSRFYRAEMILMETESSRSLALLYLWNAVRAQIPAGPPVDAPTEAIRTWINDDANAQALEQVQTIVLPGHGGIAREIGRLRGLSSLTCNDGEMTTLPDEIADELAFLPRLDALILRNQAFTEIPEVVERIPNLTRFDFAGNEEIHTIGEQLAERFSGYWFLESLENSQRHVYSIGTLVGLEMVDLGYTNRYGNLPEEQLTEIPFSFWFRERFMIPNILTSIGIAINVLVTRLLLQHILPPAAVNVSSMIFSILAVVIGTWIFALNAILCHVIEPIVIAIRKSWGYSGMVQLR